jgi:hypothetical protein
MRRDPQESIDDDEDDGLNVVSGDEEEEEGTSGALFEPGQPCDVCSSEEGRIGMDPTCRGAYDGDPVLLGANCAADALKSSYGGVEGVSVIVEPFGEYSAHYYYRLDEMPAYQFVRGDVEAISWLLLTIGDTCARCSEQSRHAWLTRDFVDERLPENRPLFRNLDGEIEHLCNACASAALAESYLSLDLPLMTAELPRSAMGVLMPTSD